MRRFMRYDTGSAWMGGGMESNENGDYVLFDDIADAVAIERFFAAVALAGALIAERMIQENMSDHFADQLQYEIDGAFNKGYDTGYDAGGYDAR